MTIIKISEAAIQMALMDWVRWEAKKHPKLKNLIAYPAQGGAGVSAIRRGMIRKAEGQAKDFPDLMMLFPSHCKKYPAGFLEIKREGERLRKGQKEWIECLLDYGYFATWATGFDAALVVIKWYAGIR